MFSKFLIKASNKRILNENSDTFIFLGFLFILVGVSHATRQVIGHGFIKIYINSFNNFATTFCEKEIVNDAVPNLVQPFFDSYE